MKTLTTPELDALVRAAPIARTAEFIGEVQQGEDRHGEVAVHLDTYCVTQTVTLDEIGVTFYTQTALDIPQIKPTNASFNHDTGWDFVVIERDEGRVSVVDEDGDDIALLTALEWACGGIDSMSRPEVAFFYLGDWPELVPETDPVVDVESTTHDVERARTAAITTLCSGEPTEHLIERDNERDLRLTGWEIASASSHHYEGPRNTRWTDLTLYRAVGGKYVAEIVGVSLWQGETDRHSATVCDDLDAVIAAFGHGKLGKEIYYDLDIDTAEVIS